MKSHYDPWYVRLPDDRVVKAKSTASIRHHVEAGNIPLNSMARRNSDEEWVSLVWIAEFADLGGGNRRPGLQDPPKEQPLSLPEMDLRPPQLDIKGGVSARLDPMRLQTVGVRGLMEEMIAAFDSTVGGGKLTFAGAVSVIGSLAVFLVIRGTLAVYSEGIWLAEVLSGVVAGFSLAVLTTLLTRQTHEELSRMRPVSRSEAAEDIGPFLLRVFLAYVVTIGLGYGIIVLLQQVPDWLEKPLRSSGLSTIEIVLTAVWAMSLLVGIAVGCVFLVTQLLPPILVVEGCSLGDALREWRSLLREHRGRVLVYEGLALALALATALPLLAATWFAQQHFGPLMPNAVVRALLLMVRALSFAPALAFLAIANLFIYLNLRYEHSGGK